MARLFFFVSFLVQLSSVNFQSNGALQILLQSLVESFCEFKTHEYIENRFIMERLKQRLKVMNVSSRAVCNCHNDDRLPEVKRLTFLKTFSEST